MRRTANRKNAGGAWVAGLGVLGLLVTVAIILYMTSLWSESLPSSSSSGGRSGPGPILQSVKKQVAGFNERNVNLVPSAVEEANRIASPAPAPAPVPAPVAQTQPAPAAPAPATPSPAAGTPSGGTPIGPISPVITVTPIQEGAGARLRPASRPVENVNKAVDERNKELEKALKGE
jgi:hypothetical protein